MPSLISSGLENAGERVRRGIAGLGDFFARTNFPQSQFSLYAQRILAQLNTGDTVASFNREGERVLTIGGSAVGTLNRGENGSLSLRNTDGSRADEIDIDGSRIRTLGNQAFMQLGSGPIISLNFNEQLGMQSFSSYSPDFSQVETITAVGTRTVSGTDSAISDFLSGITTIPTQSSTTTTTSETPTTSTATSTSSFTNPTFTSITNTGAPTDAVTQAITPTPDATQTTRAEPTTTLQRLTDALTPTAAQQVTTTAAQQVLSTTLSALMTTLSAIAQSPAPGIGGNFTGNGTDGNFTGNGTDGNFTGNDTDGNFTDNGTDTGGGDQTDNTAAIAGSVGAVAVGVGIYFGREQIMRLVNYCFGRGQAVALHVPAIAEFVNGDQVATATVDNPMYSRERTDTVVVATDGRAPADGEQAYTVPMGSANPSLTTFGIGGGNAAGSDYAAPVAPPRGVASANGSGAPEYMAPDPNQPGKYAAAQQALMGAAYAAPDDGRYATPNAELGAAAYAEPNAAADTVLYGAGGQAVGDPSPYEYSEFAGLSSVAQAAFQRLTTQQVAGAHELVESGRTASEAIAAAGLYAAVDARPQAQAADSVHHAAAADGLEIYGAVETANDVNYAALALHNDEVARRIKGGQYPLTGASAAQRNQPAPAVPSPSVIYSPGIMSSNTPSTAVASADGSVVSAAAARQRASQGGRGTGGNDAATDV